MLVPDSYDPDVPPNRQFSIDEATGKMSVWLSGFSIPHKVLSNLLSPVMSSLLDFVMHLGAFVV